ncbi:alpha/beta fold hydrolase [Tardiphaga sp.]|uniref:alpha/beta hydrolase n=1 Tax=Tardiphaga sp. TaxID=1926292 RepID=UPI0026049497|nr:alpha/beta fold hydrolase [Tardiphaga sp.]MDB5619906.1 alpha/beta hydrolase [Tardiphaga sp.]
MPIDKEISVEEFRLPASDDGINLYVRNKRPRDMSLFSPDRTILFVHGATYPASTSFDLALDGHSWMDYIASRGFDVYLLDLRGYGRSTRPREMDEPASDNSPIMRGDVALRDIATAVSFIRKRRALDKICLLGWSWGTTLVAAYAAHHPDEVARLVLYAPLWIRRTDVKPGPHTHGSKLPAYRTITQSEARARWLAGVSDHAQRTLIPDGWFEKWAAETWATDPASATVDPPALRAPNGVVEDVMEFNNAGRAYYDPAGISSPTLLVSPEWDGDTPPYMAHELFEKLSGTSVRKIVSIPEGTHSVIMERNRDALFTAVQTFLEHSENELNHM